MNYNLNTDNKTNNRTALLKLLQFMKGEQRSLILAVFIMMLNAGVTMLVPYLIGYAIDHYIVTKEYHQLIVFAGLMLVMFVIWAFTEFLQTKLMGGVGQRMLYALRNEVFSKLQHLPVAFFNQNKSGDLISRINNDTDSINQFFSQSLLRFVDSIFSMTGAIIFVLSINPELGAISLIPAVFILAFVLIISPWVKKKNALSLQATGGLSAEIQESIHNFKTIIAFNRRDYFRDKFTKANTENYKASFIAGIANGMYSPVFTFLANVAMLLVLSFGIYLIMKGQFTVGLLISFIAYVQSFYQPLQQLAQLWASYQTAMAAWDRVSIIINLKNNMLNDESATSKSQQNNDAIIEMKDVSFAYPDGKPVLKKINIQLHKGKTYAFVGPTGGGKSTTASLIARLYDPNEGEILLDGKNIKQYLSEDKTNKIGFILQEPFLFSGTLKDNILYGNTTLQSIYDEDLLALLTAKGLSKLLVRFENGLQTQIIATSDTVSLGQKQLIAFVRAVLREPEILILDEATANIDTVTEQLLEDILDKLPPQTTKIIIAHRLNTIKNADEIFFVNGGTVTLAGTFDQALALLMEGKRAS